MKDFTDTDQSLTEAAEAGMKVWAPASTGLTVLGGLEEMWKTVVLWPRKVAEHCKGSLKGKSSRSLEDNSVGSNVDSGVF